MEISRNVSARLNRRWGKRVRWTAYLKAAFLDHLAASCNITDAAAAIGVHVRAVYGLRSRDAEFMAGWDEALRAGYQVLETRLLGHALAGGPGGDAIVVNGSVDGIAPLSVDLGLRLLSHRAARLSGQTRAGAPIRRATREEVEAAILHKLDAIEKHDSRG